MLTNVGAIKGPATAEKCQVRAVSELTQSGIEDY